jgi:hypothetical protein
MMTVALVMTSCGIETLVYLGSNETPVPIADSRNALDFNSPVNPTIGMNLYYRIYDSEADAITDKNMLDTRQGSESIPGSAILYLENTLKYTRPARYSLKTKKIISVIPTIPDSAVITTLISIKLISNRIFIDLDTSSILGNIEENPSTDDVFELLRFTGTGIPVSFDQLPVVEDLDYRSGATEDFSFYVQFFAASYGFDLTGSSTEVYSNAVYLGRIILEADV